MTTISGERAFTIFATDWRKRWANRRFPLVDYFDFDILPIVRNRKNATTATHIKNHGRNRISMEDRSYSIAQCFGHRFEPHYTAFKLHYDRFGSM